MIEDPDSHVGLIVSERVKGPVGYSIQIVHTDGMGPNKHVPVPPEGAKHALRDIVYSLVARAEEIIEQRKKAAKK